MYGLADTRVTSGLRLVLAALVFSAPVFMAVPSSGDATFAGPVAAAAPAETAFASSGYLAEDSASSTAEMTFLTSAPLFTSAEPWASSPVTIRMLARVPGRVMYHWDSDPGTWREADGPIVAPEGKHVLSAAIISEDGVSGSSARLLVRSDFRVPVSLPGVATLAGSTMASLGTAPTSGQVTVRVTVRPAFGTQIRRIGGQNRYDVSTFVSSSGFSSASTVIIASGEKFPDALTASGLAGALDAPLLLVKRVSIPDQVAREIGRLGARKVIVCGGPATVSDGVLSSLRGMGLSVERIGGANRFAVAGGVADRIASITGGSSKVFVARGDIYPDALSLGPIAFQHKAPILLVLPGAMPAETRDALGRGRYSAAYIAGGTGSVTPAIATQIGLLTGSVTRWGGRNRYEAAVTIASAATSLGRNSWSYVGVAKGTDYADALCGGVGVGRQGGVLLLTPPVPLAEITVAALSANAGSVRSLDVLGGPASVTPATYEQIRTILF